MEIHGKEIAFVAAAVVLVLTQFGIGVADASSIGSITVFSVPSSTYPNLQAAVQAAEKSTTTTTPIIQIAAGIYSNDGYCGIVISNVSNIVIRGDSSFPTIIDCSGMNGIRALTIDGSSTVTVMISRITFQNGYVSDFGGAVAVSSSSIMESVTISNCTFINNTALGYGFSPGGGLYILGVSYSTITVANCNFVSNSVPNSWNVGGGGLGIRFLSDAIGAVVNVIGGQYLNNMSPDAGGGALIQFDKNALNCSIDVLGGSYQYNSAAFGGGIAVRIQGSGENTNVNVINGFYASNVARSRGGGSGVYFKNAKNCTIKYCGGIYQSNIATAGGGGGLAVSISGTGENTNVILINSSYTSNAAQYGAGELVDFNNAFNCNVDVNGGVYQDNNAGDGGGGLQIWIEGMAESSHITMSQCTFIGNVASQSSGGGVQLIFIRAVSNVVIYIQDSIFASNVAFQGGGLAVSLFQYSSSSVSLTLTVARSAFNSNDASTGHGGGGGGLAIDLDQPSNLNSNLNVTSGVINIQDCHFHDNTGSGLGGAALLVVPDPIQLDAQCNLCVGDNSQPPFLPPSNPDCQIPQDPQYCTQIANVNNYVQNYYVPYKQVVTVNMDNVSFDSNAVNGTGGALALSNGNFIIRNVSFTNNAASQQGGGAYTAGIADIIFAAGKTSYINNTALSQSAFYSNSRGKTIVDKNATLTIVSIASPSQFNMAQGQIEAASALEANGIDIMGAFELHCPVGFAFRSKGSLVNVSVFASGYPNAMLATTYTGSCVACVDGQYSMESGYQISNNNHIMTNNWTCHSCPYGADCSGGRNLIVAQKDFWGHLDNGKSVWMFTKCPLGYCCQDDNGCNPMDDMSACVAGRNRSTPLCGSCLDGYSRNVWGKGCTKNDECNDGSWAWSVLMIVVLGWVIYALRSAKERIDVIPLASNETEDDRSAIRKFFAAIKKLLSRISEKFTGMSAHCPEVSWMIPTLSFFMQNAYFLFAVQGGYASNKIVAVFTSIANMHGFHSVCMIPNLSVLEGHVLQLLGPTMAFGLLGLYHGCLKLGDTLVGGGETSSIMKRLMNRTGPAAMQTMMLAYSIIVSVCGTMLHCVDVAIGQNNNNEDTIRVLFEAGGVECGASWQKALYAIFILIVVPLPLILFSIGAAVRRKGLLYMRSVISVIERPYRDDRWYWPSVVLLRRLSIAIVYAFDQDPASQGIWFCVLFVVFLVLQLVMKPHKSIEGDIVETCSLMVLTIISLCTLRTGSYLEANVILSSSSYLSGLLVRLQAVLFFVPLFVSMILITGILGILKRVIGTEDRNILERITGWFQESSDGAEMNQMAESLLGTNGIGEP